MTSARPFLLALLTVSLLQTAGCGSSEPRNAGPAAPGGAAEPGADATGSGPLPASSSFDRAILVTIDTLRADHVGCYGAEKASTPTLDDLAGRGVRFEHAISPVPVTLPSHTSLMTGLQPPSHGVRHNGIFALGDDVPVLAERMREAGFATAAFVAAVVLDPRYGLDQGFDTYDADVGFHRASKSSFSYAERTADLVVDSALAWLAEAPDHFFLWMHLYDPHADYDPPPAFRLSFPEDPYAGEIAFADSQVGRFLDAVRERWPDDRTLVVVTSDHGDALGEHGELSHSYGVYDSTQHVPLIMAGPGLPRGVTVPGVVRLVDVAPTILALAGAAPLPDADGRSLAPLWSDPSPDGRVAYLETLATRFDMGWSPLFGIRTDRWKYVRAPRPELYDLDEDPDELENVIDDHAETAAELDHLIDDTLSSTRSAERVEVDAERRAQLESLGYVMGGAPVEAEDLARVEGPDPKDHVDEARKLNQAAALMSEDEPEAAREALELIRDVEEGGRRVHSIRSKAGLKAGDLEVAARAGKALVELGEEAEGRVVLGTVHLQREDLDAAESEFRKAYDADARGVGPLVGLAEVAEARGDREAAERWMREAIETVGSATEPRWRLAALLIETGRAQEGEALLTELPASVLARPNIQARLGRAQVEAGNYEAAIRHYSAAAPGLPDHVGLRRVLVALLDRAGRSDEALPWREELLRLEPDDPDLQNNVAWYLAAAHRDLDRALELARRAVRGSGGSAPVLDTLATVHLARGEAEEALAAADRAVAAGGGDDPHVHYVRGAALAALGRSAEAREALARSRRVLGSERPDWAELALGLERELEAQAAADPSAG